MNAVLDVSPAAFEEIKERLIQCGLGQWVVNVPRHEAYPELEVAGKEPVEVIDLGALGLRREIDEDMRVFLVYQGKIIKEWTNAVPDDGGESGA